MLLAHQCYSGILCDVLSVKIYLPTGMTNNQWYTLQ